MISVFQMVAQSQNTSVTKTLSLEECIRYAEEHNYSLHSAGLSVTSSEISLKQAKENIAPSVSASASQGFSANNYQKSVGWNGNYGINAGMTLFKGILLESSFCNKSSYMILITLYFSPISVI